MENFVNENVFIHHLNNQEEDFLQDFHHLDHDHQFHHHHHYHGMSLTSSSSNPLLGSIQTSSSCPYVYSSTDDFYETKPNLMNHNHHNQMGYDHNNNMMMMMKMMPYDYGSLEIIKPVNFAMADEVSCVSAEIDLCNKTKTKPFLTRKTMSFPKDKKKSTLVKGQWTVEEDRILINLVEQYGLRKWSHIAHMLPGRIGKQCRERWHNHLRPDIKKETWSEEEDRVLIEFHKEIGNKWAEIAKRLPGRTENSIKNHWNATKRRQFSKRKCRSKFPGASLLQDYIKSLNLGASSSSSSSSSLNSSRGRRKKKKEIVNVAEAEAEEEEERIVPECVFSDEFGFNEKLLEEGCCIDSLLDDIPHPQMEAFVHGI